MKLLVPVSALLSALLALPLGTACRTGPEAHRGIGGEPVAIELEALTTYRVEQQGVLVGWLVRFGRGDRPAPEFYSVRNPFGQELGRIDGLGRAWIWQPPSTDPQLLSSGPVAGGTQQILRLTGHVDLVATAERAPG